MAGATKVPDVVLGPDAGETSVRVEAPIAEVTVYSDRARVRRRGRAAVKGGTTVVRLPDLPGAVFIDTIRVGAVGGRVLRVAATPIERERLEIERAAKVLDELDAVNDHLVALEDRAGVDEWEVAALGRLHPAAPVSEEKREGRKALAVDVSSWWKTLDFFRGRTGGARSRLAGVVDERRRLEAERDRLRADVAKLNQGGFSDRAVEVVAVLEAASPAALDLEVEYFMPGARWKPAYTLHFSSARGQLTMETTAMVEQTTGEDWPRAALAFSTATPGRGIDLPELLTWTLGERSEFVPVLHARNPPRVEPVLPMPAGRSPDGEAHAIDADLVRGRLARAARAPLGGKRPASGSLANDFEESAKRETERGQIEAKDEIKQLVADALSDDRQAQNLPPPSAPASPRRVPARGASPVEAETTLGGTESAKEEDLSADEGGHTWRDIVTAPRRLLGKSSSAPSSASASVQRSWSVPLSLYDATSARRPPSFSDPFLPAVSSGGLDYVYRSPTPASVESSGQQVRVPLASQSFHTAAFYEATPALAATAFLRARVRNDGKRPLLRGPATIFGDGEFVGIGEINTTGPSGDIELPLGADQDIRLVRQIVPSSKTTGLILKADETVYDVQLQVGNYKKQAVTVEVIDQVPVSRNDHIAVKLLETNPAPVHAPDFDGVVRWRLPIPAGETRTIKLRFQITRPKEWKLYQK